MPGSKLFQRSRALGNVCNQIPAAVRYAQNRQENIIVTCVGRSFHVYSCNHFRLICVSGLHTDDISAITSDSRFIYTSAGNKIFAWRSGNIVRHSFDGHKKKIHSLLPFGTEHLISIDLDSTLKVWNIETEEKFCEIQFRNDEFKITALCHPPTYLNKILLGSEQGLLQLWNIKECKLVYTFQKFGSKITILESAPAIDVIAVGLADGSIALLNLKYDQFVMQFKQDWGPVTSISFRTDGQPSMVTASTNGHIVVWNLEEKVIVSQFNAHSDTISTAICLSSEPLLFTSSPDNSIKLWIFDLPDGKARLLRIREGHAAPPLCIKYHGANGKTILSAGEDSTLRAISTVSETLNKSFGHASYNRKASKKRNRLEEDPLQMPPIVDFTNECTREKEWDNIAAIHSGLVMATTWSFNKSKMGDLKLVPNQFQNKVKTDFNVEATCICLTHCGNFVIIGYSSGDVERFNVQSGQHRQHYGTEKGAHKSSVRGVHCDNLNQAVVSGDNDGVIKFWNFAGEVKHPQSKLKLVCGVAFFRAHAENALLCIALENYVINILDCETKTVIRKFAGHTGRITDATFSPDSRWLITSSMDCSIKIWDIPSAYMIDHFRIDMACISLSMSPVGDYLATAHVNNLGIFIWANKFLFSHIPLKSIDPTEVPPTIDLPTSFDIISDAVEVNGDHTDESIYKSPVQIDGKLITMSTLVASRWQNLLHLDVVKSRNRPKIAIKTPKHASFFLPTIAGLDFQFDVPTNGNDPNETAKIIQAKNFTNLTAFGRCLDESIKSNKFEKCVQHITALNPSMIDFELKSLDPHSGGSADVLFQFMKMIDFMFATNLNFELAQSYLSVFLKEHSRFLLTVPKLRAFLLVLEQSQNTSWMLLEKKLLYGIAVSSESRLYAN